MRATRRLPRQPVFPDVVFSRVAAKHVSRAGNWDLVIAWSSFADELIGRGYQVLVVRGSSHVRRQREVLSRGGVLSRMPSKRRIRREEREYCQAHFVTVPTREIGRDPYWCRTDIVVSAYAISGRDKHSASVQTSGRDGFSLIFAGEGSWRKGFDRLAHVATAGGVDSVRVAGRVNARYRRVAQEWGLELLGQLSKEELGQQLEGCSGLVLLSREEGMARVGLEAVAKGVPVLVTPETGLTWLVEAGAGVLVEQPDDRRSVHDAVATFQKESARMRHAASVIERSWDDHVSDIINNLR